MDDHTPTPPDFDPQAVMEDPPRAAAFFMFIGYTPEQVIEYLVVTLGIEKGEAQRLTRLAADHVHAQDAHNLSTEEAYAAAVNAEFDLARSNTDY